jgi:CII-binding regulator of phage lambda lysogenization HflD
MQNKKLKKTKRKKKLKKRKKNRKKRKLSGRIVCYFTNLLKLSRKLEKKKHINNIILKHTIIGLIHQLKLNNINNQNNQNKNDEIDPYGFIIPSKK